MSQYRIGIYDEAFGFVDWLGAPLRVELHPRHLLIPTAIIEVDGDDPKAPGLKAEGARVVIERDGKVLINGPVRLDSSTGPRSQFRHRFSVEDDYRIVHNTLAWPVPTGTVSADGTINGQTVEYYSKTGPAETVVKDLITKNVVNRLGRPVTVAPDLGRGATISYTGRFHPLHERLLPTIDQAGIGVKVTQTPTGLLVDCYEPRVFTPTLSEESGTLTDWGYSNAAPKNTRVIIGGQGEGTARVFKQFIDAERETVWGDVIEVFQDARDTSVGDIYATRAAETLAEGAPVSGFNLTLSETENFRYGSDEGVTVGDQVTVKIGSLTVTDILREATLIWDADEGETITPIVGERTDDPDRLIAKRLRQLSADSNDRKVAR